MREILLIIFIYALYVLSNIEHREPSPECAPDGFVCCAINKDGIVKPVYIIEEMDSCYYHLTNGEIRHISNINSRVPLKK